MADSGPEEGIKGVVEDVKGKAKEVAGTVTGSDNLTEEGKAQQDKADAEKSLQFEDAKAAPPAEDDDEVDLFGSDEDEVDPEAERIKAERVKEYEARKANKPKPVQKSVVTFEVKPWDDETDLKAMEEEVRAIEMDGLVWGASKLVPVGYGVNKLQITIVVEDDKVSMDELQERVQDLEDYVQSSDIAAMQKL